MFSRRFFPFLTSRRGRSVDQLRWDCRELALADPRDTQRLGSLLQEMSFHYYTDVRMQALQSFWSALLLALLGSAFFVYAAAQAMATPDSLPKSAWLAGLAGAIVQVISGIGFVLYGRTSHQFALFHTCLERANRFILANALCANIETPELRDRLRAELTLIVARAPLLTPAVLADPPVDFTAGSASGSPAAPGAEGVITVATVGG